MAQVATEFPWHNGADEQSTGLSEKVVDFTNKNSQTTNQATESTGSKVQNLVNRVATDKQRHNSKSRKRAVSVKVSASSIPQTREELDERLSYAPTRHFNVRTIPPWVRDAVEDDIVDDLDEDLLDSPDTALVAQHNSTPFSTSRTGRQERTGQQERYITSSGALRQEKTSRWITFARASAYPRENFHGEKVDVEWLNEHFTDYSRPWLEGHENDSEDDGNVYRAFKRKQQVWYKRGQFVILRNPFVPLAFRFNVILFAALAIGLGASIFHDTGLISDCLKKPAVDRGLNCQALIGDQVVDYYRDPSGLMAVIVDVVAIIYTIYITYDEYFSKPLGLRPAKAKVRLVLLDLFFIVFQSANLSLAFESLTVDEGACSVGAEPATSYRFDTICKRAQALSAVLLISLVAWLLTFSVSILRLVERINTR